MLTIQQRTFELVYLDFVAPQEAARILAESIDFTRQGRLALRETRPR